MLKKKGRRALLYFWRGGLVQVSALISTSSRSSGVRSMRKGAALLRYGVKGSDSLGDRFGGL